MAITYFYLFNTPYGLDKYMGNENLQFKEGGVVKLETKYYKIINIINITELDNNRIINIINIEEINLSSILSEEMIAELTD